jgi:hypothetical protein
VRQLLRRIDRMSAVLLRNVDRGMTTYDADGEDVDLLDHLLSKQRRHAERRSSSQEMLPAIKMLVGDWYIDELGVMTREITARD